MLLPALGMQLIGFMRRVDQVQGHGTLLGGLLLDPVFSGLYGPPDCRANGIARHTEGGTDLGDSSPEWEVVRWLLIVRCKHCIHEMVSPSRLCGHMSNLRSVNMRGTTVCFLRNE